MHLGGQDCHARASGAHTGDVSAEMVKDAGASAVIVGHSERRTNHGETDAIVRAKAEAAHRAGLTAIVCIGETLDERQRGQTLERGLPPARGIAFRRGSEPAMTVIAYEPVWAIGSGLTPSVAEVEQVHGHIRREMARLGVSRPPKYAFSMAARLSRQTRHELLKADDVNGALVGGASLKAADFIGIIKVYG